jgi:hypothetical protein
MDWANDQEILLVESAILASSNWISGGQKKSQIRVRKESYPLLK